MSSQIHFSQIFVFAGNKRHCNGVTICPISGKAPAGHSGRFAMFSWFTNWLHFARPGHKDPTIDVIDA
ncbi:hypothetical protein N9K58_08835, partial [Alphaproteobacteria bacterium]|nr:hypothetical protein [Alphaproteobacteria bacterium]